ncbi:hypothetical protein SEUCBS139899_008945 [Sporothrix eucalyptigena]|uniref:Asl1-like glycosyl hydrolase catalytic domain-containing protein n=1 Tax=Sporothrix eucalyptigena TaxID=1812306 RepID=A0ABP0CMB7_9PEZI
MYLCKLPPFFAALVIFLDGATALSSAKRGLVFTPNSTWPQDNYIWTRPPSDLTWYYNYCPAPSPIYDNISQNAFEFVPMLWGAPSSSSDTSFLTAVKALMAKGINISHIMTFNEPELSTDYGGSDVDPTVAAKLWVCNIIPLQELGVKVGLPACSGSTDAVPWLDQMLGNCSKLISTSSKTKNCTYDFVPLHWYGNFDGLASHIGTYTAAFPNTSIWVTEFNYNNQDLVTTQAFFNTSVDYLDNLTYIERYSYFGGFRSSVSNVGPNAAMLSAGGQLTDIGAWYLGENATGISPESTASSTGALFPGRDTLWFSLVASWLTSVALLAIA